MKSMTGFGRGVASGVGGTQCVVELAAVNSRKQLEMRFSIPRELGVLECQMRSFIQKQLSRGTLSVAVSFQLGTDDMVANSPINYEYAGKILQGMKEFAEANGIGAPTMSDLLLVPGVLKVGDSVLEILSPLVIKALENALMELDAMRCREGVALQAELKRLGNNMSVLLERIIAREQEAILLQRDRIVARIAELGVQLQVDEERLAKEIAFCVDKSDITEETVRLRSHLKQYSGLMDADSDVGRNLDFLCQEMSREMNTLAAKTADLPISSDALAMKIELSKVKEQVMNVE